MRKVTTAACTIRTSSARNRRWLLFVLLPSLLIMFLIVSAPNPAKAIPFTTFGGASATITDTHDVFENNRVSFDAPDQTLTDISAPISLLVGDTTLSALATLRLVVIPTSSGGIISFGTVEATTIIDPLLVTEPVPFPIAAAAFALRFDSGDTGMAVAMSVIDHVTGAELASDTNSISGGVLFFPAEGMDFGIAGIGFYVPKPGEYSFAFSTVVKPHRTIGFSVDGGVLFEFLVSLSPNFRDSRLDFTFTATPVPEPSPLLLLVGGFLAIALIYRRRSTAKRRN